MPRPTSQDLAGYWDMVQLSVEDVSMKFDELHQLKLNDWKIIESPERKVMKSHDVAGVLSTVHVGFLMYNSQFANFSTCSC